MNAGASGTWLPTWFPDARSAYVEATGEPPHSFELDADVELAGPPRDAWMETHGSVESSPESFTGEGELSMKPPDGVDSRGDHVIEVEDGDEGHLLNGWHVLPERGVWTERETTERAVANTVEGFAESVDVEADVTLESYDVEAGDVEIEYTAAVEGLERGVLEALHRWTEAEGEVDASGFDLEYVELRKSTGGGEVDYGWDVDVTGHEAPVTSLMEAMGYRDAREVSELRRDTGFEVEAEWSVFLGDTVSASVEYTARNSVEYLRGLRDHGFEAPPESEFRLKYDSGADGGSTEVRYESDDTSGGVTYLEDYLASWTHMLPSPVASVVVFLRAGSV